MQKLIDFVKAKSISDPSMVSAYSMIQANPADTETVLLILITALYESNRKLAETLVKTLQAVRNEPGNSIVLSETYEKA